MLSLHLNGDCRWGIFNSLGGKKKANGKCFNIVRRRLSPGRLDLLWSIANFTFLMWVLMGIHTFIDYKKKKKKKKLIIWKLSRGSHSEREWCHRRVTHTGRLFQHILKCESGGKPKSHTISTSPMTRQRVFQPIMAFMRPPSRLVEQRVRSLGWLVMSFMERRFKGNQICDEFWFCTEAKKTI